MPTAQLYEHALRLDGPTLANLELLENSEGGASGSLLSRLDTCVTPGPQLTSCREEDTCIVHPVQMLAPARTR